VDFYGGDISLVVDTATLIVAAAEVERVVFLSSTPTYLGFSSAEVTGRTTGVNFGSTASVVLPAGRELWGYQISGSLALGFLVTPR
jgi:hypothetical protein